MHSRSEIEFAKKNCIQCGKCTENCSFLSKYEISIGDIERLRELAYHCFLCGACTSVCPVDIDGRQVIMELRQETATGEDTRKAVISACGRTLSEKADYKFRNYNRVTSGAVFFPGCNFPSLYPKTSEYISNMCKKDFGIGTVYECCGKPVAETGLLDYEKNIVDRLNERIEKYGITEFITACPNCKEFLETRVDVPVVDIFTKLKELEVGNTIHKDMKFYIPCPDRSERTWLKAISEFVDGEVSAIEGINCCGLGGQAKKYEKDLAKGFATKMSDEVKNHDDRIYTFCASCVGSFTLSGSPVNHVLPEILGVDEEPDTKFSYINRMKTKFKK